MIKISDLPKFVNFSQVEYNSPEHAAESKMVGLGCLTPYWTTTGIKQFRVKVDGYNEDQLLDLDTANLFLGTLESGKGGPAYPYQDASIGGLGSIPSSLPLKFRRIHFIASEGKTGVSEEYYTYVLSANPVRVNSATGTETSTSDETEELYGTPKVWGSNYEEGGAYERRVVIGAGLGATGSVITHCKIYDDGCKTHLEVITGVGYVLSTGEKVRYPISYNTGALFNIINETITYVDTKILNIVDTLMSLSECACELTGATPGSPMPEGELATGLKNCLCNIDFDTLTGANDPASLFPTFCVS